MKLIDFGVFKYYLFIAELIESNDFIRDIEINLKLTYEKENTIYVDASTKYMEPNVKKLEYMFKDNLWKYILDEKEGFIIYNKNNLDSFFKILDKKYKHTNETKEKLLTVELPFVISLETLDPEEKSIIYYLYQKLDNKEKFKFL